jgi:tyrosinase
MNTVSRRSFLAGAASVPFWIWFGKFAAAATPRIRYDVGTSDGQRMLRTYASAVAKMVSLSNEEPGNPTGWIFQWYSHWVKGPQTMAPKAQEIQRIFGTTQSKNRQLAEKMWDSCQAHGPAEDEDYFLPWHRMFVLFLEQIVRETSGDSGFTLPYWKYTGSDSNAALPLAFRQEGDPALGSLFRKDRNQGVNTGESIVKDRPQLLNSYNSGALAQPTYRPAGAQPGFCAHLDSFLHGTVHVRVGNRQGMGAVPWAANDPVFWMHHCNIDRLWASWNRNGGKNPDDSWLKESFTFADEKGNSVVGTVKDFNDIAPLGYTYDVFEPAPTNFQPLSETIAPKQFALLGAAISGPIHLGSEPVRVILKPAPSVSPKSSLRTLQATALSMTRRLFLVLSGLSAQAQPGVLYDLYFGIPGSSPVASAEAFRVGTFNFFAATGQMEHGSSSTNRKFISFDVTEIASKLQRQGLLSDQPVLAIAPVGRPGTEARALIAEIALVSQ